MALARRTGRRTEGNLWAGFVDAMSALLLVMIFVLTIFMIMQFMLRATIIGQGRQLTNLEAQIAQISQALGASQQQNETLTAENQNLEDRVSRLQFEYDEQSTKIADFEEQVAALIASNRELEGEVDQAREEQARVQALEAMIAQLESEGEGTQAVEASVAKVLALANAALQDEAVAQSEIGQELRSEVDKLTELEQQRLAEKIATDYLREELKNSETEITALTLALEEERKRAEETLTLLAALQNQRDDLENQDLSEAEKQAALLKLAEQEIAVRDEASAEDARRIALLNQQTAELRSQLGALQGLLDAAAEADEAAEIQIATMGSSLNAALARAAAEERKRANDLESYRSEFFGEMRRILEGVEGIEIVGDRFVFSSEVLFPTGSASLSADGRAQISKIGDLINQFSGEIPAEISWIIRVDGHTDIRPLSAYSQYADNWELSQARALSVVRYLISASNVPAKRLAAAGFGEFHPIDTSNTETGLARNRRIEFKLTEE